MGKLDSKNKASRVYTRKIGWQNGLARGGFIKIYLNLDKFIIVNINSKSPKEPMINEGFITKAIFCT